MRHFILLINCVGILSAGCPTPLNPWPGRWPFGMYQSYGFAEAPQPAAYTSLNIHSIGIAGDIDNAFALWNNANASQNPSRVTFYYNYGYGGGLNSSANFRVFAVQVNYPGDYVNGDPGNYATSTWATYSGSTAIVGATFKFYIGSISRAGYPYFNQSEFNYHSFITKGALHEIGHTMGLGEQPVPFSAAQCGGQTPGQSVMNSTCGTNDQLNNLPAFVTSCDNAAIY
jgi:hypothetical protein